MLTGSIQIGTVTRIASTKTGNRNFKSPPTPYPNPTPTAFITLVCVTLLLTLPISTFPVNTVIDEINDFGPFNLRTCHLFSCFKTKQKLQKNLYCSSNTPCNLRSKLSRPCRYPLHLASTTDEKHPVKLYRQRERVQCQ